MSRTNQRRIIMIRDKGLVLGIALLTWVRLVTVKMMMMMVMMLMLIIMILCCWCTLVPGEPRRIRADVVNSTAIRVQWRPPEISQDSEHTLTTSLSGVIRGYRVYVSVDGAEPSSPPAAPRDVANAEATEMIIGGLRPDTTYLVRTLTCDWQRTCGWLVACDWLTRPTSYTLRHTRAALTVSPAEPSKSAQRAPVCIKFLFVYFP